MAESPRTTFRRGLFEFRRLWGLWRVRIPYGLLNLGAVGGAILLSKGHQTKVQALFAVGTLIVAASLLGLVVLMVAFAITPYRLLADRLTILEAAGSAHGSNPPALVQNIENYYASPQHPAPRAPDNAGTAVVPRQLELTDAEDLPKAEGSS